MPTAEDFDRPDDSVPHARLLSNGRYTTLLTGAGSGRSTWDEGGAALHLRPCIPDAWPGYRVALRLTDGTRYEIAVTNPTGDASGVVCLAVAGRRRAVRGEAARVPLRRDGGVHRVAVTLGRP